MMTIQGLHWPTPQALQKASLLVGIVAIIAGIACVGGLADMATWVMCVATAIGAGLASACGVSSRRQGPRALLISTLFVIGANLVAPLVMAIAKPVFLFVLHRL